MRAMRSLSARRPVAARAWLWMGARVTSLRCCALWIITSRPKVLQPNFSLTYQADTLSTVMLYQKCFQGPPAAAGARGRGAARRRAARPRPGAGGGPPRRRPPPAAAPPRRGLLRILWWREATVE